MKCNASVFILFADAHNSVDNATSKDKSTAKQHRDAPTKYERDNSRSATTDTQWISDHTRTQLNRQSKHK